MSDKGPRGYLEQSSDLTNSFILVAPLLVLYEVGLLLTGFQGLNGVDVLTVVVLKTMGYRGLLVLNLAILVGLAVAAWARRRERSLRPEIVPFVVVESTIYALSLGIVINLVLEKVLGRFPLAMSPVAGTVASLGAGVNEELFFRLFLLNAIAWPLAAPDRLGRGAGLLVAAILSSLIFSAAHHVGAGGDGWDVRVFVYRFLAGMIFSGLFLGRGFAVAVYTHAIYDIWVLVILAR